MRAVTDNKALKMLCAGIAACVLVPAASASAARVNLEVLSSRADLVSAGDALVRINLQRASDARKLEVRLGRQDVTKTFARRANGEIEGLLTGIPNGSSVLTATAGGDGSRIELTGHPNEGPLLSGEPRVQPWVCQATAKDKFCNQPASYELLASTPAGFQSYDPKSPPPGIEETTTTDGKTVPFIVRVETGYQDRDQYKIATLYDPSKPWEPWSPQDAWNRRLVLTQGAGCGTDRAAGTAPDVMRKQLLGKGFMVASTALNNLGHNCNPVIIAEAELMLRERIIEQYGPVRAIIGTGGSGGSISQMMLAHAYPGFFDGITTDSTFIDLFTTGRHGISGHLFTRFFNIANASGGQVYTPLDQAAVNGSPLATTDDKFFDIAFWPAIDGSGGCGGLPADQSHWTPENPNGVRCGVLDLNVNILGKGPSGYVAQPFDNVGIQYGLKALESGQLSPAKFVDINARIGGLDEVSLQWTPERTEADPLATARAYRAGYMALGNTLAQTPWIEARGPNETVGHVSYPSMVANARLDRWNGGHGSHVLWQGPVPNQGHPDYSDRMVLEMDRWIAAIQKDKRKLSKEQKVVADKPADLIDHCEYGTPTVQRPGTDCPELVRFYNSPTQVAGESLGNDTLKCQLKPLRREDYSVTFTDAEWATLQKTFPTGACDWSKPGVGATKTVPWLTFENGPGGEPLGSAPKGKAFRPARLIRRSRSR